MHGDPDKENALVDRLILPGLFPAHGFESTHLACISAINEVAQHPESILPPAPKCRQAASANPDDTGSTRCSLPGRGKRVKVSATDNGGMRSIPVTPMSRAFWVLTIAACLITIFASTIVGLGLMVTAVVLYSIGRVAGMR